jgi:hypothetical protein
MSRFENKLPSFAFLVHTLSIACALAYWAFGADTNLGLEFRSTRTPYLHLTQPCNFTFTCNSSTWARLSFLVSRLSAHHSSPVKFNDRSNSYHVVRRHCVSR